MQEEQEIEKHQILNELDSARLQLKDSKKRVDEDVIQQYEEQLKRFTKDLDNVQQQLVDAEAAQKRIENSKKKLQQEVRRSGKGRNIFIYFYG